MPGAPGKLCADARRMRHGFFVIIFSATFLTGPRLAHASDAGDASSPTDGGADASRGAAEDDAGAENSGDAAATGVTASTPLACDGALCDTTNGATCDVSAGPIGSGAVGLGGFAIAASVVVAGVARRRRWGHNARRAGVARATSPHLSAT